MRKLLSIWIVALAGLTLASCEYDDSNLWNEMEEVKNRVTLLEEAVEKANGDISALQTIVSALQNNVYVTSVETTDNGYTLKFSDGKTATISNGKDGVNAPAVSVRKDDDGNYYWTLGDEWLLVDGQKVRANGLDGESAVAPQVRINSSSKEWEISTDGGQHWVTTGVVAEGENGKDGESLFKGVDATNSEYVTVTLADGTEIKLNRYDETSPLFLIEEAPEVAQIVYGESAEFTIREENVAEYTLYVPQGWKAEYADNKLKITAPAKDLCHYDKEGTLAVMLVSPAGKSAIVKLELMAGEWVEEDVIRTLTFEDKDAKFAAYTLYGGAPIRNWSDLVDDAQYGGKLTYTDFKEDQYYWYDEGNTELFHSFATPYWGGGHVISNYVLKSYETLPDGCNGWYEVQMSTPIGGHNGSANFAVHNGYADFFNSQIYDASLKGFEFADGVERVVDHMYVTNTNYVLNSLTYGDSFNTPATADTYVKVVAYGYNANEELVGTSTFTLCNGADNILKSWEKWDLSSLGKVAKIVFNFEASDDQIASYGLNCPAYFAYDDVAVLFEDQRVFK